ncbi:hypothetical protein D3C73_832090 [compost metagenome]
MGINLLKRLHVNYSKYDKNTIKKILFIYEENWFYLGDTCIFFDKLKYLKSYFNNAEIELNLSKNKYEEKYRALLLHNPYINAVYYSDWINCDFADYDMLICVMVNEGDLFTYIEQYYPTLVNKFGKTIVVCSLSKEVLVRNGQEVFVFPECNDLIVFDNLMKQIPSEIYITDEEKRRGDQWLISKGVLPTEKVLILIDSASVKEKSLDVLTYFEILSWLLQNPMVKVLIFDERLLGKKAFYKSLLGDLSDRLIFCEGLSLRDEFCIISSDFIQMVLGPCTGIMHCISSIFNHMCNVSKKQGEVTKRRGIEPLIIVYTGEYHGDNNDPFFCWSNSPLVNCILVSEDAAGHPLISLLKWDGIDGKNGIRGLPCYKYTSELLIDFLKNKLHVITFLDKNS